MTRRCYLGRREFVHTASRLYCESLLSVDDSIARVRTWLQENGLAENTLVFYMGDNGFQWGEMRTDLHNILATSDAARVPFSHKKRMGSNLRRQSGSKPATFPPQLIRNKNAKD